LLPFSQLSASEGKGQQALVQKTESGNSPTSKEG